MESHHHKFVARRSQQENIVRKAGIAASCIAIASIYFCLGTRANAEVFVSRYVVNLDGMRVGDAVLNTSIDAKHYKVAVSADVGMLMMSTQIRGEASGARAGAKLTPEHFQIVMSGGDQGSLDVNFAATPAAAANGAARLKGVFDPLSALLVASLKPSTPSSHPCNSVFPIFTGRERFDLSLHPKAVNEHRPQSPLVVCDASPGEPSRGQAGQGRLQWEIAFMHVAKPHFWLVEHISVPTPKGIVSIDRAETKISGS